MAQTKKASKPIAKKQTGLDKVNKATILQKVVTRRELKYIYPKGVTDPLKRKAYRQKIRDHKTRLESQISKLTGAAKAEKKAELAGYVAKYMV